MTAILHFGAPIEPDWLTDYLDMCGPGYRWGSAALAARVAGVTEERVRDDHAAGVLPADVADWGEGGRLVWHVDRIAAHYAGEPERRAA